MGGSRGMGGMSGMDELFGAGSSLGNMLGGSDFGRPSEPFKLPPKPHTPHMDHTGFTTAIDTAGKFQDKLKELAAKNQAAQEEVELVLKLASGEALTKDTWTTVRNMLSSWARTDIFPILDALRFSTGKSGVPRDFAEEFISTMTSFISGKYSPTVLQLSLKIFANLCLHAGCNGFIRNPETRNDTFTRLNEILEQSKDQPKPVHVAIATLCMNYSVFCMVSQEDEASFQILSFLATQMLPGVKDPEASYRTVVAIGNLTCMDKSVKDLAAALEIKEALDAMSASGEEKVAAAIKDCKKILDDEHVPPR